MSRIVIGAYAHVDGGKTTLSEAILHRCGALRKSGRVDHEDSFLDFHEYERRKGITVYAKEARFSYKDKDYVYVDTPGHLDFVGEVNRSFQILDLAILVVDASAAIPADTIRRFRYLKTLHIPICIFLNKMDLTHSGRPELMAELQKTLDPTCVPFEEIGETVALNHEEILDRYLSENSIDDSYIAEDLKEGLVFPVFFGSALHEEGVDELLEFIYRYVDVSADQDHFKAYVYKVDQYAHLKVFSGTLRNRDVFGEYKISEIVQFNGNRAEALQEVKGSDLCAVKGLQGLKSGTYLPSLFHEDSTPLNTLTYAIESELDPNELFRRIGVLNDEFPELNITLSDTVTIDLLGDLQKDFIKDLIRDRYGITIDYSRPLIAYRESVESEVYGVGHYEPLRHYAEVLVKLRPDISYRIKGKKEFSVLIDYLQHYRPRGLLTDSVLDHVEIEIVDIRTHL
ncbi:MAG: GTP-binding protein, partial [Erysipelotrichaceae bacterium]|nr:GTP-binding protein [Erysipelotrichaceae bacterium]